MGFPRWRLPVCALRIALIFAIALSLTQVLSPKKASAEIQAFGSTKLLWTTPGNDGMIGRAAKYDLRISTKAITGVDTLSWWNQATVINMSTRVPGSAGSRDSCFLGGLIAGTRYYAILRVADETPNWSGYSNMASFIPGTITAVDAETDAPAFVVRSPRPSPTSGRTQIDFELPRAMHVEAAVFNATGRLVRTLENSMLEAGQHVLRWDGGVDGGGDAASGVYYVSLIAGAVRKQLKIVMIR